MPDIRSSCPCSVLSTYGLVLHTHVVVDNYWHIRVLLLHLFFCLLFQSASVSSSLTVEQFSSLLASVLVRLDCNWIEMESEMVWGLLHPSLLAGEGGYYLTILSSTIHFIKSLGEVEEEEEEESEECRQENKVCNSSTTSSYFLLFCARVPIACRKPSLLSASPRNGSVEATKKKKKLRERPSVPEPEIEACSCRKGLRMSGRSISRRHMGVASATWAASIPRPPSPTLSCTAASAEAGAAATAASLRPPPRATAAACAS